MDATLESAARFADPSRWVVKSTVPVFDTFEMDVPARQLANGTVVPARKLKFDVSDLHAFCQKANQREAQTGDVCPLTLGHTMPGEPEWKQPPIVGYARNFRVGPFGPAGMPAALCDFYYKPEWYDEARQYERRSVEAWFQGRMFDPIALLKSRTPMRDLGLLMACKGADGHCTGYADVSYAAADNGDFKIRYSMESFMADPTAPPDQGDDDFLQRFMRCLSHPAVGQALKAAMGTATPPALAAPPAPGAAAPGVAAPGAPPALPGAAPAGHPAPVSAASAVPTAPPAFPSSTSGFPPRPPQPEHQRYAMDPAPARPAMSHEDVLRLMKEQEESLRVQQQRQDARMAQLENEARLAKAEKIAAGFLYQGYKVRSVPELVQRFMRTPQEGWQAEIEFLKENLAQNDDNPPAHSDPSDTFHFGAPVGGDLLDLTGPPNRPFGARSDGRGGEVLTVGEQEQLLQFSRDLTDQHPEWEPSRVVEEAVKFVRNGTK